MKSLKTLLLLLVLGLLAAPVIWFVSSERRQGAEKAEREFDENEPDLPNGIKVNKEDYLKARTEQVGYLRGWDTAELDSRQKAIAQMEASESDLAARGLAQAGAWTPLGPAPIPVNASITFSGRVSAIAVHPTNPNIVYVGTAQGGLYRTLDGGTTWTPLMDNALTLAIGAVAIAPSDPTTVFVGTGESTLCGSGCFIGVGLYRITSADTNPVLSGPLNKNASNADVFTGRAVSEVIVHPSDPNTIFVATTSGIAGIGNNTTGLTLPNAGVYRSTNAMAANPIFQPLTIQGTLGANRSVTDLATEPGNPARLLAGVIGSGGDGGVYLTTNALDAVPTFTRTLTNSDGGTLGRTEFAVNKVAGVVTVYAATGMGTGTLAKSTDGGATFPTQVVNSFCGTQCFYDIGVEVDPTDANKVYLGGNPNMIFGRSVNGGASFANNSFNLHPDTQALALAPSDPNIMYVGSDGGIWKTTNVNFPANIAWTSLNNSTFSASQFMSIAIHPTDRNFLIGGTQDNGTLALSPNGATWFRTDGGDGGFTVIDKNAVNTTNVTSYHTFYNSSGSLLGFVRSFVTDANSNPQWAGFYGCGGTANGINCADSVLFYAPLVGGPNAPGSTGNTIYYGTTRLYRSIDQGTTMTDVSGVLPARISAIGISPLNDNIRLAGTTSGTLYLSTTAGAVTMTAVTGSVPARYIGRVALDPVNQNIAYAALNGFGLASGQHIWKTSNLLSGAPTWTAAGNGIPDVPVNAFAIDPANAQNLFAGTDIGVFHSTDGGASWVPFSTGLPRVAVFGLEISAANRVVKIATHGRGIWEYDLAAVRRTAFDYDGDGKADVSVFRPSNNAWYLMRSQAGFAAYQFGAASDKLVPADYTGDGKTDIAVWRPSNGVWYVLRSEDFTFYGAGFGTNGDVPAPGDYDGDGKADLAVFRPGAQSVWYLQQSTNGFSAVPFGIAEDKPSVGDFDGDGKSDIAVYRPSLGQWFRFNSSNGSFYGVQFGTPGDVIVPADYTGDGKADVAVFRPSTSTWFILRSETPTFYGVTFGTTGDIPAPADYDGDGKTDIGVFRPSTGFWYEQQSTSGFNAVQFGATGDKPTPNAFVY